MKTITKLEGTPLSEKEVAEKFQVDTDLRYPDKLETSAYEGQQKDPEGNPVILTLYRTFVNWKLKHPALEFKDVLEEVMKDYLPPKTKKVIKKTDSDLLGVLFHTDLHFDRLEHDKNYLSRIDNRTFDILERMKKLGADKLLYANLWDYFNSDHNNKTTKGTDQFNREKETESFKRGLKHQMDLISQLKEELPLDVIYAVGNHDSNRLQYLADALELYFRGEVNIDNSLKFRKYYPYGNNLLAFAHWDKVKDKDIFSVVSQEAKLRKHNYYFRGDKHRELKELFGNFLLQTLGSPASVSEWEERQGYITRNNLLWVLIDKKKGKVAELQG